MSRRAGPVSAVSINAQPASKFMRGVSKGIVQCGGGARAWADYNLRDATACRSPEDPMKHALLAVMVVMIGKAGASTPEQEIRALETQWNEARAHADIATLD